MPTRQSPVITMINTPNRQDPTRFPPYGVMSIMSYLRRSGFNNIGFVNVDYYRYTVNEIVDNVVHGKTDIVGLSAVTSTSYNFVKELSLEIKKSDPNIVIVLGGNMAASAEIILEKTGVDFCVLGEGELIFKNLINAVKNKTNLKDVSGLAYVDNGSLINTGYEVSLNSAEIYDVDWDDLGESIEHYIFNMFDENGSLTKSQYRDDKRTYESHRRNKKHVDLIIGKGCVAKCTFCHRWDKGIRYIPVALVMERLDFLINQYNVGFIEPQIEAFATNKKWLIEFCEEIKKRDILWAAGAVRAKSVTKELIKFMKDAGCVSITYGLETGSDKMLNIMEKKTSMSDNYNAQKWTIDNEMTDTVVQLVIGMPGEDKTTIKDTVLFTQYAFTLSDKINPLNLSINYVQALPGTPLYEYGRNTGLIGVTVSDEEKYLIMVSDQDAANPLTTLNFTKYPMAIVWGWRIEIISGVINAYVNKYGFFHTLKICNEKICGNVELINNKVLMNTFIYIFFWYSISNFRRIIPFIALISKYKQIGSKKLYELFKEYMRYIFRPQISSETHIFDKSLRKIVHEDFNSIETDSVSMRSLRKGR